MLSTVPFNTRCTILSLLSTIPTLLFRFFVFSASVMLVDLAGREQERLSMCRTERFKASPDKMKWIEIGGTDPHTRKLNVTRLQNLSRSSQV